MLDLIVLVPDHCFFYCEDHRDDITLTGQTSLQSGCTQNLFSTH